MTRTAPTLRTEQRLALTPQLQQSIHLLQLSALELSDEIGQMMIDNPFLERADDAPAAGPRQAGPREPDGGPGTRDPDPAAGDEPAAHETSADWDESADGADSWSGGAATGEHAGLDAGDRSAPESLADHLLRQALTLRLSDEEAAALHFLIGSLNDDGYLEDSLAELAATLVEQDDDLEDLQELIHRLSHALRLLQSLEPAGVGARNLAECLLLQLQQQQQGPDDSRQAALATAAEICRRFDAMQVLARRDARALATLLGEQKATVEAAIALIARLEPKPGRRYATVEHQIIIPEIIVRAGRGEHAGRIEVLLNPDALPRLQVNQMYADALEQGRASPSHQALQQHLQQARWFVRSVQQRYETMLRVAGAIVRHQHRFFRDGEVAMRPLTQADLAVRLGLHESTVSRATTAKYMATPRGTFELKYFFSSALATAHGADTSSTAVQALLRQLIAAEDPARPLSDSQLSARLKTEGIGCARRTVAKYREMLGLPAARLRRQRR